MIPRTFFRYFAGKEDVVFAWYEQLTGELTAALWERELATVLERRLPRSSTRALRAKVIVAAALSAFTLGIRPFSGLCRRRL